MVGWKSFPQTGYNGSVWLTVSPADPSGSNEFYKKTFIEFLDSFAYLHFTVEDIWILKQLAKMHLCFS
ncbi:hypothetical protein HanXRQr2_Chr06g0270961 [Helianthus annuus]|uniref:Uncharacterized protein n=1 Tax=Helianthus annuus TaxID=4232 RepID=A0A9K3NL31_HELAN|nr:hypothetical protein HanXRQr2_Chr06g0270961 [Helianthus annuus]